MSQYSNPPRRFMPMPNTIFRVIENVVVGIVVALVSWRVSILYERHRISVEVEDFLRKAGAAIQQERYGEVQKLSESLSDQARKTATVDLTLTKATAFRSAFDQQDFDIPDRSTLLSLKSRAEFLEDREKTAQTACLAGIIQNLLDNPTEALRYFQLAKDRDDR